MTGFFNLISKKLKHFNRPPFTIGIFLVITTPFIFACFRMNNIMEVMDGHASLGEAGGDKNHQKLKFLDDGCDVFDGKWVWDDEYPLYSSRDCEFIDVGFRCSENGRPDNHYTKWRWQPTDCNLPRFDAKLLLETLRNKQLVFVGDSIGRNQWESLLCMAASNIPKSSTSIYEVNGNSITTHKGRVAYMFKDYNCTIEYYKAPFLVFNGRPPLGAPEQVNSTLRVDVLQWPSWALKDSDVLIFNTGRSWSYQKTFKEGRYFQEGGEVKMDMSVETGYQRSLETLFNWINTEVNLARTKVYFQNYVTAHYRRGQWRTETCNLKKLPELWPIPNSDPLDIKSKILSDVILKFSNELAAKKLNLFNLTKMTVPRKDGHPTLYYLEQGDASVPHHRPDCNHWCLPGVPDAWNEILFALLLNHESIHP